MRKQGITPVSLLKRFLNLKRDNSVSKNYKNYTSLVKNFKTRVELR